MDSYTKKNSPLKLTKIVESEDQENFKFSGYASVFGNVDLGGDVIMKGAFEGSLKARMPKLLFSHKMDQPLGRIIEAFEDEKGLFVSGVLPKDDSFVRERIAPQVRAGAIDGMSIGFNVKPGGAIRTDNKTIISKIDLFEVSLVVLPMNPEADLQDFKSKNQNADKVINKSDLECLKDVDFNCDLRTLEGSIKNTGRFSNGASVLLASLLSKRAVNNADQSDSARFKSNVDDYANQSDSVSGGESDSHSIQKQANVDFLNTLTQINKILN